jgi:membrane-associated phospholipid phosphatase
MKFELELIRWLQEQRNGFFDFLFEFITLFGEELIIIGILGLVYWTINKEIGKRLAMTVFFSIGLNSVLKVMIGRLRPFQVDNTIVNLRPETSGSYAMPSGHTQSASTTFFGLAYFFKKRYLLISAIIITVLVGLSRMYIGVHYLTDVLVGGLLGLLMVYIFNYFLEQLKDPHRLYRIIGLLALLVFVVFIIIEIIKTDVLIAGDFYHQLETMAKMIGAMVGFVIGIEIERKYVHFENHKNLNNNVLRFIIGIAIVFLLRVLLKEIFSLLIDSDQLTNQSYFIVILALFFDFIRYGFMVIVGIGIYPLLFKKLKI